MFFKYFKSTVTYLSRNLQRQGYISVDAPSMEESLQDLGATPEDFSSFLDTWNRLPPDPVYGFRQTTQTRVLIEEGKIERQPRAAFLIPYGENKQLKDMRREFAEAEPAFLQSKTLHAVWRLMRQLVLANGKKGTPYISGCHQFRIIKRPDNLEELGPFGTVNNSPTPEGVHQDGADLVLVMFVNSSNMAPRSAESRLYDLSQDSGVLDQEQSLKARQETCLFEHNLTVPFESLIIRDRKVKHDNRPLESKDSSADAYRDVLVMWAREFNKDDKLDPSGPHPDYPIQLTNFPEDNQ